jgi:hypothetical protein
MYALCPNLRDVCPVVKAGIFSNESNFVAKMEAKLV